MISVAADKDAGVYEGSYVITYTIFTGVLNDEEIECSETGSIDFNVGNLAMLSATSTTTSISQGTSTATISLTFTNSGTVDLYSIYVYIDPASGELGFTIPIADHWEGTDAFGDNRVEVGDIPVGETGGATIEVGIDIFIPEGVHKIMFGFDGFYYDPDTHSYKPVQIYWQAGSAYRPMVKMG